jgi:hypothetical protein
MTGAYPDQHKPNPPRENGITQSALAKSTGRAQDPDDATAPPGAL